MDELIKLLREAEVISYEPVQLRGGESSNFYADIKKACGDPALLALMARYLADALNKQTTCVAVSGYGGLPLGTAVSLITHLPLAMVRDTAKQHGRGGVIDGYVPQAKDMISLIDDVFTTGSSLHQTAKNLESTGAEIIGCCVVIARGDSSKFVLPVSHLLRAEDILNK